MEGRELQRRKQVQIPNICAQEAVPAAWHRFSPFRTRALTVTVSAVFCSWPGKTDLGRTHNTGSCNAIWPPSYSSLVHEGGSLDFWDQISQDISTCIWPWTWKANLRSEILSESRVGFAERGRANLVAHSQAPRASAFTCQAWLISQHSKQGEMSSS